MAKAMGEDVEALPKDKRAAAFLTALEKMIKVCGMENLKMSDYGITRTELPALAKNARETMGGLFELDRYKLSFDETVEIYEKAFR
jgi:alcohol dehydrogenase